MAALSTTLTLPSSASVTVFPWSCLPCIWLCSCQRALAFSLTTSAKFSGFIWCAPFLPPLQHLIGLTLKNVFTPLPLCTHFSDSDHRRPSASARPIILHTRAISESALTPVALTTTCPLMTPNHISSFTLLSPRYLMGE